MALIHCDFFSEVLQLSTSMCVILPQITKPDIQKSIYQGTYKYSTQWCGKDDFLYGDNVRFRDDIKTLDLDLTYEEGPGGHEWACWDVQIQRVLDWLPFTPPTGFGGK
jgi:enterochelin esterase-like enzyme